MLERFKPKPEDSERISVESLQEVVVAIFEKMGVSSDDANEAANVLTMTDLRGVETHGVSNMLRAYVDQYTSGQVNPRPNWRIERETPGTAVINADRGLGIILGRRAMDIAVKKAKTVGVGIVTMNNGRHLGAVGHFSMHAAKQDMVGMCATAAGTGVLPTFAVEPRFGTNPISIAAPANNEAPLLFDAATSQIAGNKFSLARRVGSDLLPGWIADADGVPIMEETPVPDQGWYGSLLPAGGTRENGSHKGYGFMMIVEVLGAFLSGSVPGMFDTENLKSGYKHYFAAYDIAAFTDVDQFKDKMDRMLRMLRETKPARGHDRVLYPGLAEYEDEQDRRANGVPLHKEVLEWFDTMEGELGVPALKRVT
ncbi:MAG: Ldh family oxidoreductase [SAR202 cluster bacterium]|jgi:LDH2 family malate/lactate/ureidoglycolate dehydrogenase|nr:Ldh family oxidoreductase [SAR202 cluster bacterium]MDP6301934.1 Ldh family oxidoreductase [SAR202 cluster bacterium]MDP7104154.1 Ldh family oxidoreductase [SAR202 cluster bacterium]MDP7225851.1 Ldh family oxidoreductase [SAR202 cluster bacterium]MDP7415115.1 Ldh family oxidoreductase [SAR202 cluster bacterium]|tara:strand:+ start:1722 stop:2825 length:1104 start_codon:yes stop_codon:yes gene_type:complete